jgi:transposase
LFENTDQAFGGIKANEDAAEAKIKELHVKIGRIAMDNGFLEQGLTRIHGPRIKR